MYVFGFKFALVRQSFSVAVRTATSKYADVASDIMSLSARVVIAYLFVWITNEPFFSYVCHFMSIALLEFSFFMLKILIPLGLRGSCQFRFIRVFKSFVSYEKTICLSCLHPSWIVFIYLLFVLVCLRVNVYFQAVWCGSLNRLGWGRALKARLRCSKRVQYDEFCGR